MKRYWVLSLVVVLVSGFFAQDWLQALQGSRARARQVQRDRETEEEEASEPEPPPLPEDQRLLAIHRKFVQDAENLAREYERDQETDKAITVYREILRLVPRYQNAQQRLAELEAREARAQRATFTVQANRGWQDTGITVVNGKPIAIQAEGTWTFNLKSELGPDGMAIPEELRDFNLGCLLGVVDTGNESEFEPFVIGQGDQFMADRTGKLYVRMYDIDPSDNEGSLTVQFMGTFRQ